MRLPRPYVPWSTRREVIERQLRAAGIEPTLEEKYTGSDERATRWMIEHLFPGERVELNHDPALCNRLYNEIVNCYYPDANDPDYLVYMSVGDHDIRTRVRGEHGQHSDLALRRKRKRKERKMVRSLLKFGSPSKKIRGKRNWPSRPLRSRNDLRRER